MCERNVWAVLYRIAHTKFKIFITLRFLASVCQNSLYGENYGCQELTTSTNCSNYCKMRQKFVLLVFER